MMFMKHNLPLLVYQWGYVGNHVVVKCTRSATLDLNIPSRRTVVARDTLEKLLRYRNDSVGVGSSHAAEQSN